MADNMCVDDGPNESVDPSQNVCSPDAGTPVQNPTGTQQPNANPNGMTVTPRSASVEATATPTSAGLWTEGTTGKLNVPGLGEVEGPNARAGVRQTNDGMLQVGGQANLVGVTATYDGPDVSAKFGVNAGVGAELRSYGGNRCGVGADIGPVSAGLVANQSCASLLTPGRDPLTQNQRVQQDLRMSGK